MSHPVSRAFGALLACIVLVPLVRAQSNAPIRLILTCQNVFCDQDFYRTELTFTEFVRDVSDADVQVLVTSQPNGGGGQTFTLRFIGQGALQGRNDELTVPTGADATDDTRRRAILRSLRAGLVGYAARLGRLDRFEVTYTAPAVTAAAAEPARDPWNRWVFTLSANGNFNGQKRYRNHNLNYNASARRVTEDWKTTFSAYANENTNVFVLTNGTEDEVTQSSLGTSALVVKSLGAQLSAGLSADVNKSTFSNFDLSARIAPGVEYDFFPYSESTKRLLTLRYQVGARFVDYRDTTIYRKTEETLYDHTLSLGADFKQPWGSLFLSTSATQYLNHLEQYSISTFSNASIRLFKGLSVNFYAGVDLLRNQRNISGEGVSDDDIYTRRRALETGYSYFGGGGLRYTFGSAFTGAVNPRFSSGGSFFISN
jgi:hypothetical protein